MRFRKSVSLVLVGSLFAQSLAPLAYAQQQGVGDPQQPSKPDFLAPTDPRDLIIPDSFSDLPNPPSEVGTTNRDDQVSSMWTPELTDFRRSVDFTTDPKDPDTWVPAVLPNPDPISNENIIGRWLPWEKGSAGSVSKGEDIILPPKPNNGGVTPPKPGGGGTEGGGATGGAGEIYGYTNTSTGFLDFNVPIVSFSGKGQASVDLSLHIPAFSTSNDLPMGDWRDTYDIRFDISRQAGTALITTPSGLKIPFKRNFPLSQDFNQAWTSPNGFRADLVNVQGLGYQLKWKNGDVWFLGGSQYAGYVTHISYRRGGSIGIQQNGRDRTITSGGRSVTIQRTNLPAGTAIRITAPNGVTEVRAAPGGVGDDFVFPGGVKRFRVFMAQNETIYVNPGASGGGIGVTGRRVTGYKDSKSIAANSPGQYTYTYYLDGKLRQITRPDGKFYQYKYTNVILPNTSVIDPGATEITHPDGTKTYDRYRNSQYIGGVDASNFTTTITRNAQNDVVAYRDQRGQTWSVTRDANGNAISTTNPLNQTSTATYSQWGDVVSTTNALGKSSTITYDSRSLPISATDPLGQTVFTATYNLDGRPLTISDAMGRVSSMSYDSVTGDLLSTTSPEGLTTSVTYNALGLPTTTTAPGNKTTTVLYDVLMRVTRVTDPNGAQTNFTYDLNDNLLTVRDPLNRTTTMTYDVLDNLITSTNPRGDQEVYTYKANGLVGSIRNGRGKTRTFDYTARGDLKYVYLPDGTTEFYTPNGLGQVSEFTGSGRGFIKYFYDAVGRLSTIDYPNMTDTTFTYDAAGRRIAMTDTSGQTSWFYDDAGRLTTLNQAGKVTSYTYNLDGSRATMTQPAGTTTYTYDSYGRPTGLTNPFGEVTGFTYDSLGRLDRKTLHSGVYEQYTYDNLDRLSVMGVWNGLTAQNLRVESYTYNGASEVLSHTIDGVVTNYTYDAASQLINESRPGYNVGYTFDGNGNRLSKTVNGNVENYTYDDGDKLLTQGFFNYSYDQAGRRTVKRQGASVLTTYAYDDESRLTSSGNTTYTYNGLDTRTKFNTGGNITEFHRDGSGVTAPVISEGQLVVTPGISSRPVAGQPTYMHGGIKDITAQSGPVGAITASRVYDAYGASLSGTGQWSGKFGFGGKYGYQQDGNGLQLLGHRYYDPSTGTFITRDPIKDGRNWYSYCGNNPINAIDADGLTPVQVTKASPYWDIIKRAIELIATLDPVMGKKLMEDLKGGKIYVDVDLANEYGDVDPGSTRIVLAAFMVNYKSGGDYFFAELVATLLHEGHHKHSQKKGPGTPDRELASNDYTLMMLKKWSDTEWVAHGLTTLGIAIGAQIEIETGIRKTNLAEKAKQKPGRGVIRLGGAHAF